MSESFVSTMTSVRRVFARFAPYVRMDRMALVSVVTGLLCFTLSGTFMIWLLGKPVNQIQAGQFDELKSTLAILVVVLLVNQAFWLLNTILAQSISLRFIARVRQALHERVMTLSFSVTSRYSKGDLLARLSNDVEQIAVFVIDVPLMLAAHFNTLVLYSVMIVWIDWGLGLVVLAFAPIFYLQQRYFSPRKGRAANAFYARNGQLLNLEDQSLSNLRGISSFNAQAVLARLHGVACEKMRKWALNMRVIDASYGATFTLTTYLCGIIIIFAGIDDIKQGELSVGQLISFLLYLGYLSIPVRGFAHAPIQWQGSLGAVERVLQVFDSKEQVSESVNAQTMHATSGEIEMSDVTFAYNNDRLIYDHVSIRIPAGETWALVGPSGSGKSTFARLLMRFYDVGSGSIQIDGVDVRDVTLASLRDNIAVVWQDPFLINETIIANLRLAQADATEQQVVDACKASRAWEFISQLEAGLNTVIGAEGIELSAGQYQRLSIAQAFLRDAPILILDEASSALDSESEQAVIAAVNQLRSDRTTLIIAHRYSSVRGADRVMYFNGDGSVLVGSHDELLERHPGYRDAVEWQVESV